MREIKFRAWATEGKEMLYDVGIECRGVEVLWYDPKLEEEVVVGDRRKNSLLQYTILMQYTGLKIDGEEIYEGDILQGKFFEREEYETMEVKWHEKWGGFLIEGYPLNVHGLHSLKKIGNIYENPELLEKK